MKFVSDAKSAVDFRDVVVTELDRRITSIRSKLTTAGLSPRDKAMMGARIEEMDSLKDMFTQVEFEGGGADKKLTAVGGNR